MPSEALHIAVVDIGNLKNLGWVVDGPTISEEGTDIDLCIDALAKAAKVGPLALGFEAPMFVPYGKLRNDLDKARTCEGDRAFSASAGACVLTKGLVIVPYILVGLKSRAPLAIPTFKWRNQLAPGHILLFEAFVSHMGKKVAHIECARLAMKRFPRTWQERASLESDLKEPVTMNLLGAMLLRMGWTQDVSVLSEPCLVVRHKGSPVLT